MRTPLALIALLALGLGACTDTATEPTTVTEIAAAKPGFAAAAKPSGKSIVALAQETPALSSLVAVVLASDAACDTDFAGTLGGTRGRFTVFAPTNAAFDDLAVTLLGAGSTAGDILALDAATFCGLVPNVLAYHVTRGRHHSQSVLSVGAFKMLNGQVAEVDPAIPSIAGAELNVGLLDISASNGIVHVVNDVLLP